MAWESQSEENESEVQEWPSAGTRLNWAKNNFRRRAAQEEFPVQWKMKKLLVQMMNLIALNDLIEEDGSETFFTPVQKREWIEWYRTFRPDKLMGRPKTD